MNNMFTLNPFENPDALWQYTVMILVSGILGYLIGLAGCKRSIYKLEIKLAKLEADLESCLVKKAVKDQRKVIANSESKSEI